MSGDKNDEFGNRMKEYEGQEAQRRFLPLLPICVRIDGKNFSNWTRNLERPYDARLSDVMIGVTRALMEESNAVLGYTQSDEISLILYSDRYQSQVYFDGKIQKLVSVLASMATGYFNEFAKAQFKEGYPGLANFDCRAWTVPNQEEAANAILWREKDATKNSISPIRAAKIPASPAARPGAEPATRAPARVAGGRLERRQRHHCGFHRVNS
jgi:tRNA(His) 5'-end guanylyltransferase